jgi:TIGR03009 family protein
MRYSWLALAGLLLWQSAGRAQQPPSNPPATPAQPPAAALDPAHDPLDAVLVNWESAMKKVDTLAAQCSRIEDNKTFQVTKAFVGTAKYMKPNLGMLEMYQKDKPENFEKIVVSGPTIYQYIPAQKEIRQHHLPAPKSGQVGDDNFLSFLFGMKAEEAKRRYELKLTKEDQYYFYVGITPRLDADKADFRTARLVLNKDSLMPRQLWFEQPNGDTITWDFPKIESGLRLNPAEFTKPAVPQGWKMVDQPQERQPVIRPAGQ